jgi:hypothetical protein
MAVSCVGGLVITGEWSGARRGRVVGARGRAGGLAGGGGGEGGGGLGD